MRLCLGSDALMRAQYSNTVLQLASLKRLSSGGSLLDERQDQPENALRDIVLDLTGCL